MWWTLRDGRLREHDGDHHKGPHFDEPCRVYVWANCDAADFFRRQCVSVLTHIVRRCRKMPAALIDPYHHGHSHQPVAMCALLLLCAAVLQRSHHAHSQARKDSHVKTLRIDAVSESSLRRLTESLR
eukprot:COSAG01_NODE_5377_length_4298_cov_2.455347_2_plen_127_part_00